MDKGTENALHRIKNTNGQQIYEKMFNIPINQRNAN